MPLGGVPKDKDVTHQLVAIMLMAVVVTVM
jgi:hypothetical protein